MMAKRLVLAAVWTAMLSFGQSSLRVEVIEGGGAIHNVASKQHVAPRVRVTDLAGRPVPFAAVTFELPEAGPGGTVGEDRRISVATGDNGEATLPGMRLNGEVGVWTIRVEASYRGRTGKASVMQISAAPVEAYLGRVTATVAQR